MYDSHMKLTLNIDDELLTRVMASTGAKTKTDAIHAALAEVDRRHKLIELLSEDIGIDFDKDIDTTSWEESGQYSAKVAETPPIPPEKSARPVKNPPIRDDRKPRSRR